MARWIRTCIACRKKYWLAERTCDRPDSIRSGGSAGTGKLIPDPDRKAVLPGRGAWVHRECVHSGAIESKVALSFAFKTADRCIGSLHNYLDS